MSSSEISVGALTNKQLADFIAAASAELARRADFRIEQAPEPTEDKTIFSPNGDDMAFVRWALMAVKSGELIVAAEKTKYEELAERYKSWFSMKQYPASLRGRSAEPFRKYGRFK